MINTNARYYDYYTYGELNAYGQRVLSDTPKGKIKISIEINSQSIQDNINYNNCNYIGLTQNMIDDTYVIAYENQRLKVLYVNPKGRYKQVYLSKI